MSSHEEQAQSDPLMGQGEVESDEAREVRMVSTSMSLGRYLSMYEAIIQPDVPVARA